MFAELSGGVGAKLQSDFALRNAGEVGGELGGGVLVEEESAGSANGSGELDESGKAGKREDGTGTRRRRRSGGGDAGQVQHDGEDLGYGFVGLANESGGQG